MSDGVNMDVVWGALAGAGLGGVMGAAGGGSKTAVVAGVAGGALLGGLIGYAISGAYYDLTHWNPFARLEKWNPFGWLTNWKWPTLPSLQNVSKSLQNVSASIEKMTTIQPSAGTFTSAAVQPGSGGKGAASPAVSPIHGTVVEVPSVIAMQQKYGTPAVQEFLQRVNLQPNNVVMSQAEWNKYVNNPPCTTNPAFPGQCVVQLPGAGSTYTPIKGYKPQYLNNWSTY
jgi:hypothetical protein